MLPRLRTCCQVTAGAVASLDSQLPYPLSQVLAEAIEALDGQSFGARIRTARAAQEPYGQQAQGDTGLDES
ncbi:hypothetical protein HH212_15790 [Massilia forsythiae]|uniref:Uncharacterized protein n=1 Tax=Massilia forsythiae TaxID=2728020 RepID=A0A7Z2VYP3_9BURK|nr:hypothetical protein [Massilia forsythiae]QJE01312.1 hypothetical protein HH212_15790 [Massilia forsythiae]